MIYVSTSTDNDFHSVCLLFLRVFRDMCFNVMEAETPWISKKAGIGVKQAKKRGLQLLTLFRRRAIPPIEISAWGYPSHASLEFPSSYVA